jgi:hypothetical protein
MPSVSYIGVLLAFATLLSAPVSAQNGAPNGALKNARVQHVVVRGSGDAMEVEIQTSGAAVAPDTQAITGPDRIVVDFPGALPAAELCALTVNRGALKGVRSGLFSSNPPITRVVLDLTEPRSYQISNLQNAIVLKLNPSGLNPAAPNPTAQGPANSEPGKSGPVTAGPVKHDSVKTGSLKHDSAKTGSAKIGSGKTGSVKAGSVKTGSSKPGSVAAAAAKTPDVPATHAAKLQIASLVANTNAASVNAASTTAANSNAAVPGVPAGVAQTTAPPAPAVSATLPPMPLVDVTFANGMLRIHAENATLSQVLFEVQRQTQAEIAIPAGAEREQIIADLGPAPARDVLAALLNGSPYNFIFVGNEHDLQQVILTLRQPNIF